MFNLNTMTIPYGTVVREVIIIPRCVQKITTRFEIKMYSWILQLHLKSTIFAALNEVIQLGTAVQVGNQILLSCTPCHKPST